MIFDCSRSYLRQALVWAALPDSTDSSTKGVRLSAEASAICRTRFRPMPFYSFESQPQSKISLPLYNTSGTFLRAANVRLVHLDPPGRSISVRPNYLPPKRVGLCPDPLVALHAKLTLQSQCADLAHSWTSLSHETKQSVAAACVEDGSHCRRNLIMATDIPTSLADH